MDCEPGDIVVQRTWNGRYRDVHVETLNLHSGHPAFTGHVVHLSCDNELVRSKRVWGYQAQIVANLGQASMNEECVLVYQ